MSSTFALAQAGGANGAGAAIPETSGPATNGQGGVVGSGGVTNGMNNGATGNSMSGGQAGTGTTGSDPGSMASPPSEGKK